MRSPTPGGPPGRASNGNPIESDIDEFHVDWRDDDVSRVLNDPECLALIDVIAEEPSTAEELEDRCGCAGFTVDRCLEALADVGLVEARRRDEDGPRTEAGTVEYAFALSIEPA